MHGLLDQRMGKSECGEKAIEERERERERRFRAECAWGSGGNYGNEGNREMGREGLGWVVFGVGFVIQTNPKAHSPNMGFVTQYNTTQPNPLP